MPGASKSPLLDCNILAFLVEFYFFLFPTLVRLRDKSPRSEDLEADDEQGDKTDNDHDR